MSLEVGNFLANAAGAAIGSIAAVTGWQVSGGGGGALMAIGGVMGVVCSLCVISQLIWWASLAFRRPGK